MSLSLLFGTTVADLSLNCQTLDNKTCRLVLYNNQELCRPNAEIHNKARSIYISVWFLAYCHNPKKYGKELPDNTGCYQTHLQLIAQECTPFLF